jgi:endoglucanase
MFHLSATAIKHRKLAVMALGSFLLLSLQAQAATFRVSSIGYHPAGSKVAILEDLTTDKKVEVSLYDPQRRNPKFPVMLGATVYKITNITEISDPTQQGPALHKLLLDFSDFKEPGNYEIRIEGTEIKSEPIKINDYLYWDTLKPVVKSFYYQRCGQDVEDRALKMVHMACHLKDANFLNPPRSSMSYNLGADSGLDVIGGWHNGGDYAKYVTSTAISAAKLMAMNEWNPKPFKFFHIDYPLFEPGYGKIDDLHHEIQAGLDWLMSMQRPDGALYRKVAGKQWPGKVKPESDEQPRYIYGYSTQDTAIATAAWAMAARDFKKSDLGYSVKSLLAAEKAWAFLEARPDPFYQKDESDYSGSGEFLNPRNQSDMPYRLWAAAELYLSTGKNQYHQFLIRHMSEVPVQRFSWMNPALQGFGDYLLYANIQDPDTASRLRGNILSMADAIASEVETGAYGSGLSQYGPSSNVDVAENGSALMLAYRLSGDVRYRQAASRLANYFFGINPQGITYVTGISPKSVQHPTHRWMEVAGKVLPGYLVDGPNNAPTDGKTPKGQGPASYVDEAAAKSVNESKLLNNASLAYLLALLNESYNAANNPEEAGPKSPLEYQLAPEKPQLRKK